MNAMASELLVLYASQTGNAEFIAKNVHGQAVERGYKSTCLTMDDHEKVGLIVRFFFSPFRHLKPFFTIL